jgi:DNA-directed RNA polymerase subunit H (RpoH/RPB5)
MFDAMFGRSRIPRVHHHSMVPKSYLVSTLVVVAVLTGLLVKVWFFPAVDEKDPYVSQIRKLEQERDTQERIIGVLRKQNKALLRDYTKMGHLQEIDMEALSKVQDQLKADQNERLKMEEELIFLRGMVASKLGKGVLHLQRLRLESGEDDNSYLYAFTVSKVLKNPEYIEGSVYVTITGYKNGKKSSLPLNKVSKEELSKLKMRFKHFQNMEGEFLIPSGFKPSGVTIEVRPEGDKFKPIKKSFKWVVTG